MGREQPRVGQQYMSMPALQQGQLLLSSVDYIRSHVVTNDQQHYVNGEGNVPDLAIARQQSPDYHPHPVPCFSGKRSKSTVLVQILFR